MGPWPVRCAQTGAGCPGLRDGPDVRAGVAGLGALWIGGVRMSGLGAGCPAAREEPDVRAFGRMSGLTRFSFGTFCDGRRISGRGPDVRGL